MKQGTKRKKWGFLAVFMAVLALALLAGGIYAKYIRSVPMKGNIIFAAGLAEDIRLIEHLAGQNADGTYTLDLRKEVSENTYVLMPGVDIPKDPCIVVEEKSMVDAYLYMEVTGECPAEVTYTLAECWIPLTDAAGNAVTGINGGGIYVYGVDGTAAVLDETFSGTGISILEKDTVYVSDALRDPQGFSLNFYAYMAQISGETDAAKIFEENFGGTP